MSNTPSKAEIEALVKRHGATSYRNRADTQHPAYGFTEDGLNGLIDEVLAKWGTPQPVVLEDAAPQAMLSPQVSVSENTLRWWRELATANPQDLVPRIDAHLDAARKQGANHD